MLWGLLEILGTFRVVPDFGSSSTPKPVIFTNPAQIWLRLHVAGFRFLSGLQNGTYEYCNVLYFIYFRKIALSMLPYFRFVCSLCWDLTTDEISHFECPSSLSSFVNKSQIQPPAPAPGSSRIYVIKTGQIPVLARFTNPESITALFTFDLDFRLWGIFSYSWVRKLPYLENWWDFNAVLRSNVCLCYSFVAWNWRFLLLLDTLLTLRWRYVLLVWYAVQLWPVVNTGHVSCKEDCSEGCMAF